MKGVRILKNLNWARKINIGKLLLVAGIYTVAATILRQIEAVVSMKYYMSPEYFGVWSKIMMPSVGSPPMEYFLSSVVITFATGLSITIIYYYMRDILPKNPRTRTFYFADIMIGTSFVFFTLPTYLLFNLPWQLHLSWFITTFIILLIGSYTIVKVIK